MSIFENIFGSGDEKQPELTDLSGVAERVAANNQNIMPKPSVTSEMDAVTAAMESITDRALDENENERDVEPTRIQPSEMRLPEELAKTREWKPPVTVMPQAPQVETSPVADIPVAKTEVVSNPQPADAVHLTSMRAGTNPSEGQPLKEHINTAQAANEEITGVLNAIDALEGEENNAAEAPTASIEQVTSDVVKEELVAVPVENVVPLQKTTAQAEVVAEEVPKETSLPITSVENPQEKDDIPEQHTFSKEFETQMKELLGNMYDELSEENIIESVRTLVGDLKTLKAKNEQAPAVVNAERVPSSENGDAKEALRKALEKMAPKNDNQEAGSEANAA